MAEQQVKELKEKLQSYQAQFDNYKIQCKQLEQFLESQSAKKQQQIRQLKEQAIKKQKQFSLMKTEMAQIQSENKNLKTRIKQLQDLSQAPQPKQSAPQIAIHPVDNSQQINKILLDLQQYKTKCTAFQLQVKDLQQKIKQNFGRHLQQTSELKQQIREKDRKIKQNLMQIDHLKSSNQMKQIQINTKSKNLQITIERSKKVSSYEKQQQLNGLRSQLAASDEKIIKLVNKIKNYENRIRQLQLQKIEVGDSKQIDTYDKVNQRSNKSRNKQKGDGNESDNQQSENEKPDRIKKNQITNNSISALILTKKYYTSPFMEFQSKNVIKLYKTQKNGRINKSLGSFKYKVNHITYDTQFVITKIIQNIQNNLKYQIKSRIVIFGAKRLNKKQLLWGILTKLKDVLVDQLKNQEESSLIYLQLEDSYVKNTEIRQQNVESIMSALQRICSADMNDIPRTPKKYEKMERQVLYFQLANQNLFVEIITSNFTNADIKQSMGLANALDLAAYSKVPQFNHDRKVNTQIILTINPIVGLYEQCKSTLTLASCKNKQLPKFNVFDWRQSPQKGYLLSSTQRNPSTSKREKEHDKYKVSKLNQQVQFYKSRFHELIAQIKIILNTNSYSSYLKKTPVILSFQKILKFAQSTLNQNQTQHYSLLRSPLRVNQYQQT